MQPARHQGSSGRCKGQAALYAAPKDPLPKPHKANPTHPPPQALFLPEASDYIGSSPAETVSLCKSAQDSEFVRGLQDEARRSKLPINVGIHEPAEGVDGASGGKIKNTLIWIDERGDIVQRYQKLHLFDVDIQGGPTLKESQSVERGSSISAPFQTPVGCVGMTICFDLRFPEISLSLRRQGAQVLVYPSAFTVPTGRAHWEPLLRARAIETQSYVIAAAQSGFHNEKRCSYGHSVVVSPWGEVVADLGGFDALDGYNEVGRQPPPALALVDLDLAFLEKVRKEVPLLRRTDVYPEV
ncbi:carbon-nitrogen family protein [Diplodia corticola]|uniref:Carbon-nitrogen family protein n=1 Tax=Diplodia corticola TaxID=236234 RepID=A0A1J9SDZ4_9PEZI|nr:carbon-nitrogen family protein [Diplodia corticola]OJD37805.1 carbon-nitrogen family protein [Diplodia corticola]